MGRKPEMRTIKTTSGAKVVLDGDLLGVMETLYREVTARREFDRTFDDITREISHLISQMTELERSAYLQEALAGGLNGSDTLAALARARWSSGDAAGAEATIDRALAADPDNIELQRLARAIKRTSGRVDPEARHPRS